MRVALFGGSFDPPHRGHLAIARAAADACALDTVLFMPTGRQPLKPGGAAAGYKDRLAMVELAIGAEGRFAVSAIDAPRSDGGPNYTVDVLEEMRRKMPEARLYAIAGADSFLDLPRWREPQRLLALAEWIVVSRPGWALERFAELGLTEEERRRVRRLETVHEDISATELRERLRRGEQCGEWIPEGVLGYIREKGLYR